jgi:UDP-glucose 4-epimerase
VNFLITGAAGFIGSHLSDLLLQRGHEVVGVDNLAHGTLENLESALASSCFTLLEFDVRETERLAQAAVGCDVVVHLAALKIPRYGHALDTVSVNVDGARSALEAARHAGAKCVMASTSDVYGKSRDLPFREDSDMVLGPSTSRRWAYAASKLAAEHLAHGYEDKYGLPVAILRYFGTYGERQYLNWWGGPQGVFLKAIDGGEPIELHGDGTQTRCFIHVEDLVGATVLACEREAADGEIFNVGTTEEVSIGELADRMHGMSGRKGPLSIRLIPYDTFPGSYEDVARRVPDPTKSRELLGFEPAIDLDAGIRRLWSWYDAVSRAPESAGGGVSP